MIIYLSGPISGDKDYFLRFLSYELKLKKDYPGCEVINPAKVGQTYPKSFTYDQFISHDLMLLDSSDAIAQIPGWKRSTGACIEFGYAVAKGKKIIVMTAL